MENLSFLATKSVKNYQKIALKPKKISVYSKLDITKSGY